MFTSALYKVCGNFVLMNSGSDTQASGDHKCCVNHIHLIMLHENKTDFTAHQTLINNQKTLRWRKLNYVMFEAYFDSKLSWIKKFYWKNFSIDASLCHYFRIYLICKAILAKLNGPKAVCLFLCILM